MKWRLLNCKLAGVFRKKACLSTVKRLRIHRVARLTKISITLSRYFRIAQVRSFVLGITSLLYQATQKCSSAVRVKMVLNILNCVLVLKLSPVHCCTCATISIQGQLYRYSYHQISVTIHRHIEHSTTVYPSSDGYFQQDSTMSLSSNHLRLVS